MTYIVLKAPLNSNQPTTSLAVNGQSFVNVGWHVLGR